ARSGRAPPAAGPRLGGRRHPARRRVQPAAADRGARRDRRPLVISELFDETIWRDVPGFDDLDDITYHLHTGGGIARIAFNRPEVRNAFRPRTVDQLARALDDARQNPQVGAVLLTGNGPSPKDGGWAFC